MSQKNRIIQAVRPFFEVALAFGVILLLIQPMTAYSNFQEQNPKPPTLEEHKQAIAIFNKNLDEYMKLRDRVKGKLPKLSKQSTPEEIQARKEAFETSLRAARVGAQAGDIFTPEVADYIRTQLKAEFKEPYRSEVRKIILEAETDGVPLRVNYPYPEAKELTQVPAPMLLALPELPPEVKYRFVGRNMLLVDRENNLIIDYMANALP